MKNAFCSFVFGGYEKFIPFYALSINKVYPTCDIIIFYNGELSDSVKESCKFCKNLKIYTNQFANSTIFNDNKIKGGSKKLFRHVLNPSYFKNYDNVYFGDIDILVLKETTSLFNYHKKQAQRLGVPFSNKLRTYPNGDFTRRLTGLHFVIVAPYFKKIGPIIDKIMCDTSFRTDILEDVYRDEEFLFKINNEAFDLDKGLLASAERPWHGFHLGLIRGKTYLNHETIKENSSLSVNDIKHQLVGFLNQKDFISAFKTVYCPEIYYTYLYFKIRLPLSIHISYFGKKRKKYMLNKISKIKTLLIND